MIHVGIDITSHRFDGRTCFKSHELDVFQYFPDCFYKVKSVPEAVFILDVIDMSYYTARTLCSYHLTKTELYFDVVASMLSHLNFVDSKKTSFLLSESRYNRLRDFSKSTRIGEMSQGINALFVSKRLDFPYIIDFDLAKEKTSATLNIQTTGRTPDFVFMNRNLDKIGLLESKGTMMGKASSKNGLLSEAMEQIDAVDHPCFDYLLPICTKFENNNDITNTPNPNGRKSSINYALIEKECANKKDTENLWKLHYASWFYLVGDFGRVTSILANERITPLLEVGDQIYEIDNDTEKENPIWWVKRNFFNLNISKNKELTFSIYLHRKPDGNNFKIGIYKKVIDNLLSDTQTILELPEGSDTYLRKYPDGTLLYIKPS
jgi:hypothetical protein